MDFIKMTTKTGFQITLKGTDVLLRATRGHSIPALHST